MPFPNRTGLEKASILSVERHFRQGWDKPVKAQAFPQAGGGFHKEEKLQSRAISLKKI